MPNSTLPAADRHLLSQPCTHSCGTVGNTVLAFWNKKCTCCSHSTRCPWVTSASDHLHLSDCVSQEQSFGRASGQGVPGVVKGAGGKEPVGGEVFQSRSGGALWG